MSSRRIRRSGRSWWLAWFVAASACGSEPAAPCTNNADCGPGRVCVEGRCRDSVDGGDVLEDQSDGVPDTAGDDAGPTDAGDDGETVAPLCTAGPDHDIVGRITVYAQQAAGEQLLPPPATAFLAGEQVMIDGNWLPPELREADAALAVLTCAGGELVELPFQVVRPVFPESAPLVFFRLARDLAAEGEERVDRDYYLGLRRSGDTTPSARLLLANYEFSAHPPLNDGVPFETAATGWTVERQGCAPGDCGAAFLGAWLVDRVEGDVWANGYLDDNGLALYCREGACAGDAGIAVVSPPVTLDEAAGETLQLFSAVRMIDPFVCAGRSVCGECSIGPCERMDPGAAATISARFVGADGETIEEHRLRLDGAETARADNKFAFPTSSARYENFGCDPEAFVPVPAGAVAVRLVLALEGGAGTAGFDNVLLFRHAALDRSFRCRDADGDTSLDPFPWEPVVEVAGGLRIEPQRRAFIGGPTADGFTVTTATPLMFPRAGGAAGPRHDRAVELALELLQERSRVVLETALPESPAGPELPSAPAILVGTDADDAVHEALAGRTVPVGGLGGEEGYLVLVRPERIVVAGSGPRGVVYGAAALAELFPVERVGARVGLPFELPAQEIKDAPERELRVAVVATDDADLEGTLWETLRRDDYLAYFGQALRARFNAVMFSRSDLFARASGDPVYEHLVELMRAAADDYLLEPIPMPFNPRGPIAYEGDEASVPHKVFVAAGVTIHGWEVDVPATATDDWIELELPLVSDGYRRGWPLTAEQIDAANASSGGENYRIALDGIHREVLNPALADPWVPYAACRDDRCTTVPVLTGLCPPDGALEHAEYCWNPAGGVRRLTTVEVTDGTTTLRSDADNADDNDFRVDGLATYQLRHLVPATLVVDGGRRGHTLQVTFSYLPDDTYLSTCLSEAEAYRRMGVILARLAATSIPIRYVHVGMDELARLGADIRDERNETCGPPDPDPPCMDRGRALDFGLDQVLAEVSGAFGDPAPRVMMWGDMPLKIQHGAPLAYLSTDVWMVPWHYHYSEDGRAMIADSATRFPAAGFTTLGGPHVGNSNNAHLWARPYANVRLWAEALTEQALAHPGRVRGVILTRYENPGTGALWDQSPLIVEGGLAWRTF